MPHCNTATTPPALSAAPGGLSSHLTVPFFAPIALISSWMLWRIHQGAMRLWPGPEASWWRCSPTRWTGSSRVSKSAPRTAADGRKVLSDDRGTSDVI